MTLYYKVGPILNATAILLQNATEVHYKMRQIFLLQNSSFITKYGSSYKKTHSFIHSFIHILLQVD